MKFERRHFFSNDHKTRYVINDRLGNKKKGTWVTWILPLIPNVLLSRLSHVWVCATLWMIAHQVPQSLGFFTQEQWSGLPFPTPGDLLNPGIEPRSLVSPALVGRFFTTAPPRKPLLICNSRKILMPALSQVPGKMTRTSLFYWGILRRDYLCW